MRGNRIATNQSNDRIADKAIIARQGDASRLSLLLRVAAAGVAIMTRMPRRSEVDRKR